MGSFLRNVGIGILANVFKEEKMKKILGVLCVLALAAGTAFAADTVDVDVYVTPGDISVSLSANPTYYNFGTVSISASSNSATAISLINNSSTTVKMEKTIAAINGGGTVVLVAGEAPNAINEFRLRCVENESARPALDTGFNNAATDFSTTLNTYNNLTDNAAAQTSLDAWNGTDPNANIWFQIDMPPSVDNSAQRKFDITYRGTAQ